MYRLFYHSISPLPYHALSNLLTLFSHDVPTLPLIQHVWDFLLSREPVAVVWLAAAVSWVHLLYQITITCHSSHSVLRISINLSPIFVCDLGFQRLQISDGYHLTLGHHLSKTIYSITCRAR